MKKALFLTACIALGALQACDNTPATNPSAQPSTAPSSAPSAAPSSTPSSSPDATPSSTPKPSATPLPTPSATPLPEVFENALGMRFQRIEPGSFTIGSPQSEANRDANEIQRQVTLSRPFWVQTTETTQAQWQSIMGSNPAFHQKPPNTQRPIENISWNDVQDFIKKLKQEDPLSYRLPTEAEWEYAARAGSTGIYHYGANPRFLGSFTYFIGNSGTPPMPQTVGTLQPNGFGLYDMQGNVFEYVQDGYTANWGTAPAVDPAGPAISDHRVYRDCYYNSTAEDCRLASRNIIRPEDIIEGKIGFRLVIQP